MSYYYSYSDFLKEYFGKKLYKICIDGGFTCPNRDGTLSSLGCIFCSEGGSGDFSADARLSITEQIAAGRAQTAKKYMGDQYIAYFQAFTNTYAPIDHLRALYTEAIENESIAAISIGTRPDCLNADVISLLKELHQRKPVFLELGLQTIHQKTADFINRGYETKVFDQAVLAAHQAGLRITIHVILGLPGESQEMQLETIKHLNALPIDGIKFSMLHILKGTPLANYYETNPFPVFTFEEYTDFIVTCLENLRPDIVVERLTGDGPRDLLIAPTWSLRKRMVLNTIMQKMKIRKTCQGHKLIKGEKICPQNHSHSIN